MQIVFNKTPTPSIDHDRSTVSLSVNSGSLPEIIMNFANFLKASGFSEGGIQRYLNIDEAESAMSESQFSPGADEVTTEIYVPTYARSK